MSPSDMKGEKTQMNTNPIYYVAKGQYEEGGRTIHIFRNEKEGSIHISRSADESIQIHRVIDAVNKELVEYDGFPKYQKLADNLGKFYEHDFK